MSSNTHESKPRSILVMLATGKQGSSVVRALANANALAAAASQPHPWYILAQTRNPPSSPKAGSIFGLPGVHAVKGLPTNPAALFSAANLPKDTPLPIWGVFSVQQSADNPKSMPGEIFESKKLADAAKEHGVKHFVYSSVQFGGMEGRKTHVPHFESKREIEEYIEKTHSTLPTTILRPVTFMDQLCLAELAHANSHAKPPSDFASRLTRHIFFTQLKPGKRLQFIAVSDIGVMAAIVFAHPEVYINPLREGTYLDSNGRFKDVDLAGDELSGKDMADVWREVFANNHTGYDREFKAQSFVMPFLSKLVGRGMKEVRLMFEFFNEPGFNTDIPALRVIHPKLKDFQTFLKQEVLLEGSVDIS
ncbi:NmrA domain-containing protein [Mycena indigotica]|uniref:NmrA domain-containing protein n=1 Tax=Mycena indigotica TaxID=2126181 RepID=A0A8H6S1Y3_9AGAR|nr:NmrA domain-containing protein [Mycena indigotica]KAF7291231.1 NmrA domain-containing protein [Mycena indigotica]